MCDTEKKLYISSVVHKHYLCHLYFTIVDFVLTKVPHAFLVRVIQEEIALLDGPVDLEAKTQAGILHQVRQDVLS